VLAATTTLEVVVRLHHAHQTAHGGSVPVSANICGTVAGALGISTSWPQVWRLWVRRHHAGLSLPANILGALYAIAWLLYGISCRSAVQVITNAFGIVGSLAILTGHLRRGRIATGAWLPYVLAGLGVDAIAFAAGRTVIGVVAAVATIVGIAPQLLTLLRSRRSGAFDARGVSRSRWLLSAACNGLWVGYGVIAADQLIALNSALIGALGAAIVVVARPARRPAAERPAAMPAVEPLAA
jgi:uncharacterized protein with PQ loop repeat